MLSISFGVITRQINCPLVGTAVCVIYARENDQCSPAACMSSAICEVKVSNPEHRRAMGCPIPALPPKQDED